LMAGTLGLLRTICSMTLPTRTRAPSTGQGNPTLPRCHPRILCAGFTCTSRALTAMHSIEEWCKEVGHRSGGRAPRTDRRMGCGAAADGAGPATLSPDDTQNQGLRPPLRRAWPPALLTPPSAGRSRRRR
jgi:hypothetical protein